MGQVQNFRRVGSVSENRRRDVAAHAVQDRGDLRSLERLSDGQLIAAELLIYLGLPDFRIAQRMQLDLATIRRWFRDPVFIAACNELTRAYCASQLVPLGLYRIRQAMADPFCKARDAVAATRFVAELAGLYRTGAPEAGAYAPGPVGPAKPIAEMTREELARLMVQGQQAQARLLDHLDDSAPDTADPLA